MGDGGGVEARRRGGGRGQGERGQFCECSSIDIVKLDKKCSATVVRYRLR